MNIQKSTAWILSGILAASALTGCGGNGSSSSTADSSVSSSAGSSQVSSESGTAQHTITVLGKDRRFDCAPSPTATSTLPGRLLKSSSAMPASPVSSNWFPRSNTPPSSRPVWPPPATCPMWSTSPT